MTSSIRYTLRITQVAQLIARRYKQAVDAVPREAAHHPGSSHDRVAGL
jgi:hypothetical protein